MPLIVVQNLQAIAFGKNDDMMLTSQSGLIPKSLTVHRCLHYD